MILVQTKLLRRGHEENRPSYPIEEALKEPLERVESRVNVLPVKVLLQLGKELGKYLVVLLLETQQLWETRNEETFKKREKLMLFYTEIS